MTSEERLKIVRGCIIEDLDAAIITVKGSLEFRNAVEDLLKDTPFKKPVNDHSDFEGLYGRLRAALRK